MQTPAQIAKCRGLLPDIPASDIKTAAVDFTQLPIDVATPHCGCPDEPDAEIANHANVDELANDLGLSVNACRGLIEAHARMFAAATGSGSYPAGCNPLYAGLHAVAYFEDRANRPSHLQRPLTDAEFQSIIDAKVWGPSGDHNGTPFTMAELKSVWGGKPMGDVVNDFVEEGYRRFGVILYEVHDGPDGRHNIHVTFPVIAGGVIGVGWFPGPDPCPGDHVNLHIDRSYTAGFQEQVGLKFHEKGHCVQLQHQFARESEHQEPMSYRYRNHLFVGYSTGDPVFGIPKSPSVAVLKRLYGGEPVGVPWKGKFSTPTPPPPPDPQPFTISALLHTDSGVAIRGEIRIAMADGKTMDFIVAKKPGSQPVVYEIVPKPFS